MLMGTRRQQPSATEQYVQHNILYEQQLHYWIQITADEREEFM
jgi:hypothetical protein